MPEKHWEELQLYRDYPYRLWMEPLPIRSIGDGQIHYACRICIALHGITGAQVVELPTREREMEYHIQTQHPSMPFMLPVAA